MSEYYIKDLKVNYILQEMERLERMHAARPGIPKDVEMARIFRDTKLLIRKLHHDAFMADQRCEFCTRIEIREQLVQHIPKETKKDSVIYYGDGSADVITADNRCLRFRDKDEVLAYFKGKGSL